MVTIELTREELTYLLYALTHLYNEGGDPNMEDQIAKKLEKYVVES